MTLAAGVSIAVAAAGPPPASAPTTGELWQAVRLRPAGSEQWFDAAEDLLARSPESKKGLLPLLEGHRRTLEGRYRAAFLSRARKRLAERLAAEARKTSRRALDAEVRHLRTDVRSLLATAGLTKERIHQVADPAMTRLAELLCVWPADLLETDPNLAALRRTVLRLRTLRDRCADRPTHRPDDSIEREEQLWSRLTIPADGYARRVIEANTRLEGQLDEQEAAGIRDLNRIRLLLGMPALAIDLRLCRAARDHSTDMVQRKFFSHTSPVPGKASFTQRARLAGTTASAENIAAGSATGAGAVRMWFHSPGHLRNMLGNHRRVGLGRAGKTWTMMLGR